MKMPYSDDESMKATEQAASPRSVPYSKHQQPYYERSPPEASEGPAYGPSPYHHQEHYPPPPHQMPYYEQNFAAPRPTTSAFNDLTHATNVHMSAPPSPHVPARCDYSSYEGHHPYPPYYPYAHEGGGGSYSYYHHHPNARPVMSPAMHPPPHPEIGPPHYRYFHHMAPPPPPHARYGMPPPPGYYHDPQQYPNFVPPPTAISSSSPKASTSPVTSLMPRGDESSMDGSYNGQYYDSQNQTVGEQVNEVGPNDVLCGRGAPTNFHPGNEYFRDLVQNYQAEYLRSKRADKPLIASQIVNIIRSRGGRFLRRCKRNGVSWERGHFVWVEVDPQKSYEKACQALREGAPELRRKLQPSHSEQQDTVQGYVSGQTTGGEEQMEESSDKIRDRKSEEVHVKTSAPKEASRDDDRNDQIQDSSLRLS